KNGATVIGNRPNEALGLTRYPQNDQQVRELAAELWGDNNEAVGERSFGNGQIIWGKSPETVLAEKGIRPAFSTDSPLNQIHRRTDSEEIYFVANPTDSSVLARAVFRAAGRPELWNPVTGKITSTAAFYPTDGGTAVMLPLQATESVFVVFRKETAPKTDAIVTVSHNGTVLGNLKEPAAGQWPEIKIVRAKYGPPGDTGRTIDVQEKLQKLVDSGVHRFPAAEMAKPVDPAYKVLKTLDLEWEIDGKTYTWKGDDNAIVDFLQMRNTSVAAEPSVNAAGQPCLNVRASGHYDVTLASGKPWSADVVLPEPLEITGSWQVEFPKKTVTFDKLFPWSDSDDETIQYFSGTGVYRKTFRIPDGYARSGQRIFLDPGQVETIAELKLNGQDFGTLWMSSKVTDVTEALNFTGENQLEIRVTNLWPNRLIGDASLPQEKERQPNGTLSAWPEWLLKGEPIPDGRETFCMWNLWTKDDALLPSGLLGPVRLVPVERCDVVGK
ncbi:MAG: hypothetical protein LBQ54_04480, partial [Planctomycetaceae bacterium]|nr:hypothetical protein [Planctomycetaceae bacterium]